MATAQPLLAQRRAASRPMPRLAPVIKTVFIACSGPAPGAFWHPGKSVELAFYFLVPFAAEHLLAALEGLDEAPDDPVRFRGLVTCPRLDPRMPLAALQFLGPMRL